MVKVVFLNLSKCSTSLHKVVTHHTYTHPPLYTVKIVTNTHIPHYIVKLVIHTQTHLFIQLK